MPRPDERDYEIARLLVPKLPRWPYRAVEVICEPCKTGNHKGCVRPCFCTIRPTPPTPTSN